MHNSKMFVNDKVKVNYYNKDIILKKSEEKISLPAEIKLDIDKYWNNLIKEKPWFTRGVIFDVSEILEDESIVKCILKETDYAHYMYGNNVNTKYRCKNCWSGFVIETIDGFYVLGETNIKTELPLELHLIGGCLDNNDICGTNINIFNTATRELIEEMGIDIDDRKIVKNVSEKYIISGGKRKSVGIIYKLYLKISKQELEDFYKSFIKKLEKNNEEIEISRLVFVKKDKKELQSFRVSKYNYIEYIPDILEKDFEVSTNRI